MIKSKTIKKEKTCPCDKVLCFLSMMLKIIATIVIFIGIWMIIQQNHRNQEEMRDYEALEIFSRIDDIGHEQFAEMKSTGNPHGWTGEKEYLRIDSGYHNSKTIDERFERAKKMDTFDHEVDAWLHEMTGRIDSSTDQARDMKYHEADLLFDALIQTYK